MDERGITFTRQTRETAGDICVEAMQEGQLILVDASLSLKDNESESLSNDDRTDLDAVPREATFHATAQGRLDANVLKASFEGLLNANLKVNEDLNAIFQTREFEFQEQKQLVFQAQRENQTLHELLITERNRRSTQVVEFQKVMCVMRDEIARLRKDVTNVPAILEDSLATTIETAIGQLFRHQLRLDKDLRKCRIQLESATNDVNRKTSESEEFTKYITLLEETNSKLEQRAEKIQQELCKEKEGHHGSYIDGSPTPSVWESMAKDTFSVIAIFSRVLSKYYDSNGDYHAERLVVESEMWRTVRIARHQHWTYVLKSVICNVLFKDFEYETFLRSNSKVLFLDQEERVRKYLEYYQQSKNEGSSNKAASTAGDRLDFMFCHYFGNQIRLLPPELHQPSMTFRDYDELVRLVRNKTQKSDIPTEKRSLLVSYILAAKKVWDFHKLCLSFDPPATIFRVSPGDPFNADYMESVDTLDQNTVPTVGFMVYPGFRLRKSIIKCQVYLTLKT